MSKGKVKLEEMEPSFNINDWMKELLPDSDLSAINRSETSSFPVSTSFMDNSMQQNKSLKIENCQVAATSNNLSTASTMFQQQRSTGFQSLSHLTMQNKESYNVTQQADQSKLEPNLQQFSQQVPQQEINMQSGFVSEHTQPKLMASAFQLANEIKSEKQSQQLQGPPQVQMPIHADWVDQAFNQITQFKAACYTDLMGYHKNAAEQRNKATNNEIVAKLEKMMSIYRHILFFLRMSKSDIENRGKDSFLKYMKHFGPHLEKIRAKNSLRMQQAQQIDASFSQSVTPQLRHRGINPQSNGTLPKACNMSSFQAGSSAGVKMLDASSNRHSMTRSTQQHSPSQLPQRMAISSPHEGSKLGFEQGSPVKQSNSSSSVPRHFTFSAQQHKVTSSRNAINPLEASSSEKNNNPNIAKLAQQSLSIEHMREKNSGSPLRHIMGLNKSSSSFNIPSPQNSQHSSSRLEFSKSSPSPLNHLTPISKAADYEFSSLPLEKSNKVPNASPALVEPQKQKEPVVEGLVSSPLVSETPIPDKEDFSHDAQYPINLLINAVKRMSPTALQSSIKDIRAIVQMSDRITGSFCHGENTKNILNDLASQVRTHNDWDFASMYETRMESSMKRQLNSIGAMPEMQCHASDLVKRPRKRPNDELVREIKEINKKLMEVVVEARVGHDEETSIVRCSYCPIALDGNGIPNNSQHMFPYLVHELTVMDDYPHSSPIILDFQPPSCSESEEGKEMWMKAMSNFSSEVRILEHLISLRQMAKTWELCAREVYREFAEKKGGGDFSTTYGKWETLGC